MSVFRTFAIAAIALGVGFPAYAQGLKPIQSQTIALGAIHGDAYYTVEPDGYRVVATFAPREGGAPIRFQAVLASGQSVVFSTPRGEGETPVALRITRQRDQVQVRADAAID